MVCVGSLPWGSRAPPEVPALRGGSIPGPLTFCVFFCSRPPTHPPNNPSINESSQASGHRALGHHHFLLLSPSSPSASVFSFLALGRDGDVKCDSTSPLHYDSMAARSLKSCDCCGVQVVEAREGRAVAEAQAAQSASQVALWEGQLAKARRQLAITEDKLKVGCHPCFLGTPRISHVKFRKCRQKLLD